MARCKIKKHPVFLDFNGVIKIVQGRGVRKTIDSISKEVGFSLMSVGNWRKEAPEVVTMIHHFLKENDLKFEDLVKECETKN